MKSSFRGLLLSALCLGLAACDPSADAPAPSPVPQTGLGNGFSSPSDAIQMQDITSRTYFLTQPLDFTNATSESFKAFDGKGFNKPMLRYSIYFRAGQIIAAPTGGASGEDYCRFYREVSPDQTSDLSQDLEGSLKIARTANFSSGSMYGFALMLQSQSLQNLTLECYNVKDGNGIAAEMGNVLQVSSSN